MLNDQRVSVINCDKYITGLCAELAALLTLTLIFTVTLRGALIHHLKEVDELAQVCRTSERRSPHLAQGCQAPKSLISLLYPAFQRTSPALKETFLDTESG